MALSVVMPALEMAQETGKVVAWKKKEGQQVAKGEVLLEIETDKAVVEIEALGDGILGGITAREGAVVPVGQTIGWLLAPGEVPPAETARIQTGRRTDSDHSGRTLPGAESKSSPTAGATPSGPVRISPKARKLAGERGVDIATVKGSGPGGEILADDILKAAEGPAKAGHYEGQDGSSTIGRLMAERTTQSWTSVPHFFVSRDVDATTLVAVRDRLVPSIEKSHGVKPTHTDLIVSAVGRALRKHPRMNASWTNGAIQSNPAVNVGIAMAVDAGVVAPVVLNADTATIADIATRRKELAERTRANKLQPADLSGGTFTVSNLGMYHVDAFTAIIVQPQAGILAVGAIVDRAVVVNGQLAVRPMMTVTLSSDHRVVDGVRAAQFLNDVIESLKSEV
jgi:pyruvate dehydrogenase E2 component (dihydrolipoamide acetyltransferase)